MLFPYRWAVGMKFSADSNLFLRRHSDGYPRNNNRWSCCFIACHSCTWKASVSGWISPRGRHARFFLRFSHLFLVSLSALLSCPAASGGVSFCKRVAPVWAIHSNRGFRVFFKGYNLYSMWANPSVLDRARCINGLYLHSFKRQKKGFHWSRRV